MKRPEDIPARIWDDAYETLTPVARLRYGTSPIVMVQHLGIARAILAERDRCISALNNERVLPLYVEPSDATESDRAYDMAIDHCIEAIVAS